MGTALNESAWSTTPASNDGADSTIGTVANTSSPTSVDDWIRSLMASRAKARLDQGGALVAGGTSTALTVTTNQSLSSSHIANGLRLCVRTASAATGAATIAVDGLTAVDIKKNDTTAVASGEWASGAILDLVYSSTASAFIIANIGPQYTLDLNSLTTETALDHAADFVPVYDTTATANRKFLPRYFAPSVRATFSARKSANQTSINLGPTKVTFPTEDWDVGGYFDNATNYRWTPPAGTCIITASLAITDLASIPLDGYVHIYKNGSAHRVSNMGTHTITVIDQCNGTDYYEVFVQASDSDFGVRPNNAGGSGVGTFFSGSMI